MNRLRRFVTSFANLLLGVCRTIYCWMFLIWSIALFDVVFTNIRSSAGADLLVDGDRGDIVSNTTLAVYSVVLAIAWWMVLSGKPALKQWAFAANLNLILNYFPVVFWNWRGFLKAELDWWPVILVGFFGIIVFSLPYRGRRNKSADGPDLVTLGKLQQLTPPPTGAHHGLE